MKTLRRVLASVLIGILTFSSLCLGGCFFTPGKEGSLTLKQPTVAPPTIGEEGVLRVGVDSSRTPYAGTSEGIIVGVDVDIAAALAEEMGLKLEIVDIRGQDANILLREGNVDVVMGIQEDEENPFTGVKVGPYLVNGPAVFTVGLSNTAQEFNPEALEGVTMVAQEGSLSAWRASKNYGEENVVVFPSLSDAFDELASGAYSYAVGDAILGSFLAVDMDNINCIGILGDLQGVYIGVASNKAELVTELTKALRSLRDSGNLNIIVSKWLGPQSAEVVSGEQTIEPINNPDSQSGDETSDEDGEE